MYVSDEPISSDSEDLLNRKVFAQNLAKSLLSYKDKGSIVLGLYGNWGTGKSSVINLTLGELQKLSDRRIEKNKPIIVSFNPWLITSKQNLVKALLNELARAINYQDESKEAKKIGKHLLTYSKYFALVGLISFPTMLPSFMLILLEKTFSVFGGFLTSYASLKKKGVDNYRKELDEHILRLGKKIIIVIDDIDRLTSKEIRQVFQLVKLAANFPNTLYLLSFDRKIVTESLRNVQLGGNYLEKIVQIPFQLPKVNRSLLENVLFKKLDSLLGAFDEKYWSQTRWGNLYQEAFRKKFTSLRRIKRFINSLGFGVSMIYQEVNPIDLIAIEFLKVFYPSVYEQIRDNKSLFSGSDSTMGRNYKKEHKPFFDALLDTVTPDSEKLIVKNILIRLFPKVESIYTNTSYTRDFYAEWLEQKRICSPEKFDYYFTFAIQEGDVSQAELDFLAKNSSSINIVVSKLDELKTQDRLSSLFARMVELVKLIPVNNIKNFIVALWNISDSFSFDGMGMPFMSDGDRAGTLSYQLLKKIKDKKKRLRVLKKAIKETDGTVIPITLISITKPKEVKNERDKLVSDTAYPSLTKLVLNKIRKLATDNKLQTATRLPYLLYRWEEWADIEEPKKFVKEMLKNKKNATLLLESFAQKTTSTTMGDSVSRVNWKVAEKELEHFTDGKKQIKQALNLFDKKDKNLSKKLRLYFDIY